MADPYFLWLLCHYSPSLPVDPLSWQPLSPLVSCLMEAPYSLWLLSHGSLLLPVASISWQPLPPTGSFLMATLVAPLS